MRSATCKIDKYKFTLVIFSGFFEIQDFMVVQQICAIIWHKVDYKLYFVVKKKKVKRCIVIFLDV